MFGGFAFHARYLNTVCKGIRQGLPAGWAARSINAINRKKLCSIRLSRGTTRYLIETLETQGSLESRHSTARTCAPGDEAVRLTFPIDTASRWSCGRGSDSHALLCKPKPMKISLIPPPPESLLKDKKRGRMPGSVVACSWPTGRLFFLYTLDGEWTGFLA